MLRGRFAVPDEEQLRHDGPEIEEHRNGEALKLALFPAKLSNSTAAMRRDASPGTSYSSPRIGGSRP